MFHLKNRPNSPTFQRLCRSRSCQGTVSLYAADRSVAQPRSWLVAVGWGETEIYNNKRVPWSTQTWRKAVILFWGGTLFDPWPVDPLWVFVLHWTDLPCFFWWCWAKLMFVMWLAWQERRLCSVPGWTGGLEFRMFQVTGRFNPGVFSFCFFWCISLQKSVSPFHPSINCYQKDPKSWVLRIISLNSNTSWPTKADPKPSKALALILRFFRIVCDSWSPSPSVLGTGCFGGAELHLHHARAPCLSFKVF